MEGNTFYGGGNDGNTVQGGWVTRLSGMLETNDAGYDLMANIIYQTLLETMIQPQTVE